MPLLSSDALLRLRDAVARGEAASTAVADVDPIAVAGTFGGDLRVFLGPDGAGLVGLGTARRIVASGDGRFRRLRDEVTREPIPEGALGFVGFSFDPAGPSSSDWAAFGAAEIVVPAVLLRIDGSGARITAVPGPTTDGWLERLAGTEVAWSPTAADAGDHAVTSLPAPGRWRDEVAEATAAIAAGQLDKVVLARSVRVVSEGRPAPAELLARLVAGYPQCSTFAWTGGDRTFLGASPELLVEVAGTAVRSNPLAGSARRGEGEAEDRAIGEGLMASAKDRSEHAIVVEDVARRLAPFCERLTVPEAPSLRRMATVQHLSTLIKGDLREPTHLLDLAAALHPTPAVGGTPREEAVRFIEKVEGIDRGWYTGGIGWVDPAGNGQIAIGLRCALVGPDDALLYAGAGIVAGSDPEAELVETRLKFRPLLELLTAT